MRQQIVASNTTLVPTEVLLTTHSNKNKRVTARTFSLTNPRKKSLFRAHFQFELEPFVVNKLVVATDSQSRKCLLRIAARGGAGVAGRRVTVDVMYMENPENWSAPIQELRCDNVLAIPEQGLATDGDRADQNLRFRTWQFPNRGPSLYPTIKGAFWVWEK